MLSASAIADGEMSAEPAVRHIIIDTDTVGDDALSIIMAAKTDGIIIEGLTVSAGNVSLEQAGKNALAVLEQVGSDAPVYLGADRPLIGEPPETFSVFGLDGMGDKDLIHPSGTVAGRTAVDFILETVKQYPDEIELVCLAPMTNIAHAILIDPDTMSHVKMIWSMGTQGLGYGNATPLAEFNVYKDVAAYNLVLQSGIPVTVIGLDMCQKDATLIYAEELEQMLEGSELEQFIAKAFSGLLSFRSTNKGLNSVDLADPVAMMHALRPSDFTLKTAHCYAYAVTTPGDFLGTVMFYRDDVAYDGITQEKKDEMLEHGNVTLVLAQDDENFLPMLREMIRK